MITLLGQARAQTQNIPWYVEHDRHLVAFGDGANKEIIPIAKLMCKITRDRGVTEVRMTEHQMKPKFKVFVVCKKRSTISVPSSLYKNIYQS